MNTEQLAVIETLNSGQDIAKLMSSISLPLALGAFIGAYVAGRNKVTIVPSDDEELDQFMRSGVATITLAMRRLSESDLTYYIAAMCAVLTGAQSLGTQWNITDPVTLPTSPTPVAVMSLPSRETSTKVVYDAKGNIASTSQTEKDA